jgi:hypothetical protein
MSPAFPNHEHQAPDEPLLIFAEAPRTRKTTMALKLAAEKKYHHIPFDGVIYALQEACPQLNIAHLTDDDFGVSERVEPILEQQLHWMHDYDFPVVLDTFHLRPATAIKLRQKIPLRIAYLGYPSDTVEERFAIIRKNEKPNDWTRNWTDDQIRKLLDGFIQASIRLEIMCRETGLPM